MTQTPPRSARARLADRGFTAGDSEGLRLGIEHPRSDALRGE